MSRLDLFLLPFIKCVICSKNMVSCLKHFRAFFSLQTTSKIWKLWYTNGETIKMTENIHQVFLLCVVFFWTMYLCAMSLICINFNYFVCQYQLTFVLNERLQVTSSPRISNWSWYNGYLINALLLCLIYNLVLFMCTSDIILWF